MHSLELHRFRAFQHFRVSGLRRINLLVGMNNSGKTSILEAIQLLRSEGDPSELIATMDRRGERFFPEDEYRRRRVELDIGHLFYGHQLDEGASFQILAESKTGYEEITYEIGTAGEDTSGSSAIPDEEEDEIGERLVLHVSRGPHVVPTFFVLSRRGGLADDEIERRARRRGRDQLAPVRFISTESFSSSFLFDQWKEIALTEHEDLVVEALQILDRDVERIAFVGDSRGYYRSRSRGGVLIRLRGMRHPVPIGSMGEGMWRMLVLAICLIRSAGGTLLVDEIDTGLHHTVIGDMWRLVSQTAEFLDVQVFATTHSLDCVRSMATAIHELHIPPGGASIQRIDRQCLEAVRYLDHEIVIAAERGTEVR